MKNLLLIINLVFCSQILLAQRTDTIYFNYQFKITNMKDSMAYYRVINFDKFGKPVGEVNTYHKTGELQSKCKLFSLNPEIIHGRVTWFYKNGQKSQECVYNYDKITGKLYQWDENGSLTEVQYYSSGTNSADNIIKYQLYDFEPDKVESTLAYFSKTLGISLKPDLETALLFHYWGNSHYELKKYEEAISFYKVEALILDKLRLKARLALAYTKIALSFNYNSILDSSKYYFEKAIVIQKIELGKTSPETLQNIENLEYIENKLKANNKKQQSNEVPIRYDGLYYRFGEANSKEYLSINYLRFYPDKSVIGIGIGKKKKEMNSAKLEILHKQISKLLNKQQSSSSKGFYEVIGNKITFVLTSKNGKISYSGTIEEKSLVLEVVSLMNGHVSTKKYNYLAFKEINK